MSTPHVEERRQNTPRRPRRWGIAIGAALLAAVLETACDDYCADPEHLSFVDYCGKFDCSVTEASQITQGRECVEVSGLLPGVYEIEGCGILSVGTLDLVGSVVSFDLKTGKVVGRVSASDIAFGPCDKFVYATGRNNDETSCPTARYFSCEDPGRMPPDAGPSPDAAAASARDGTAAATPDAAP